jgi:putative transcriptional regulator
MRHFASLVFCAWVALAASAFAQDAGKERSLLLIAAEGMGDPRFAESVVLVTRHGRSQATIGVIVNRPLDVRLSQVFPEFARASEHRLHYGGPVAQGQIVYLVRGEREPADALRLAPQLFISSDGASLRRMLENPPPTDSLRVFDGYSGWAPGQLEREIDIGGWHLLPVDVDIIFREPADRLWETLLRRATAIRVRAPLPDNALILPVL